MSRHPASRRCRSTASHDEPALFTRVVMVYDVDADECREVTAAEAAAGMVRYARSYLGAGTPACGVIEQKALELLRGNP